LQIPELSFTVHQAYQHSFAIGVAAAMNFKLIEDRAINSTVRLFAPLQRFAIDVGVWSFVAASSALHESREQRMRYGKETRMNIPFHMIDTSLVFRVLHNRLQQFAELGLSFVKEFFLRQIRHGVVPLQGDWLTKISLRS